MEKKVLFVASFLCVLALTGCGNSSSQEETASASASTMSSDYLSSFYLDSSFIVEPSSEYESSDYDYVDDNGNYYEEASSDVSDPYSGYLDFSNNNRVEISNDYLSGYLEVKSDGFNGDLVGKDSYVVGELTNISGIPVQLDFLYSYENAEYSSSGWRGTPYLQPNQKYLLYVLMNNVSKELENFYCEYSFDLSKASESYSDLYDSMKIESNVQKNGAIECTVTSGSDISVNIQIFFYDDDNNVVAIDETDISGETPFYHTFEKPSVDYDHYEICCMPNGL